MKNKISILIIDDEEMMRNLLSKILSKEGYQIQTAADGYEGLDILRSQAIDLVITDMKMPRMDGYELLKIVKAEFPLAGIIVMTAYGDAYTVKDALLLGADEYITKPFKSYEISLVVERAYWRIFSSRDRHPEVAK